MVDTTFGVTNELLHIRLMLFITFGHFNKNIYPADTHWFNIRSSYIHTCVPDWYQHGSKRFEDVQYCMYYVCSSLYVIGMLHVCNRKQILLIVNPNQT